MKSSPDREPAGPTLADRLVEFFRANPDEELTEQDIALKFSHPPTRLNVTLSAAVRTGRLQRDPSASGYVYRRGLAHACAASAPATPAAAGEAAKPAGPITLASLAFLPLETHVPPPILRAEVHPARQLLQRMAVGHSSALPREFTGALRHAIKVEQKAGTTRYTLQRVENNQVRVWRTA